MKLIDSTGTYILAVDPGDVAGIAVYRLGDDDPPTAVEVLGRYEQADTIRSIIASGVTLDVVYEEFTVRADTWSRNWKEALYLNGWLDLQCQYLGIPCKAQPVQKNAGVVSNEILKRLGWWQPTKDGHANDAMRHVLVRLVEKYPQEAERLLKP